MHLCAQRHARAHTCIYTHAHTHDMHLCAHGHTRAHVYTYAHAHMCAFICMYIYACTRLYVHCIHVHVYICACVHTCKHLNAHVCMWCVHVCGSMCAHVCAFTHTCTDTHVCAHMPSPRLLTLLAPRFPARASPCPSRWRKLSGLSPWGTPAPSQPPGLCGQLGRHPDARCVWGAAHAQS